jgi:hypothetical protein
MRLEFIRIPFRKLSRKEPGKSGQAAGVIQGPYSTDI